MKSFGLVTNLSAVNFIKLVSLVKLTTLTKFTAYGYKLACGAYGF